MQENESYEEKDIKLEKLESRERNLEYQKSPEGNKRWIEENNS